MARPTTLPDQAWDHAADQAQSHLPTELPPSPGGPPEGDNPPNDVTLPDAAIDHMSPLGIAQLPDWLTW